MDKIDKLLQALAQSLGTTVEYLWGIILKQQLIDALNSYTWAIILIITGLTIHFLTVKSSINLRDKCDSYSICSDRQLLWNMVICIEIILALMISSLILGGTKILLNPEFYALQDILRGI